MSMKKLFSFTLGFLFLFSLSFSLVSCGGGEKKNDDKSDSTEAVTFTIYDFLGSEFSDVKLDAEPGQYVLCPNKAAIDEDVNDDDNIQSIGLIYYSGKLEEVGDKESKVDGEMIPNALIIPIPQGQEVQAGDIVLTWWQSGSGMYRAVVVNADDPTRPEVCYLDMGFEDGDTDTEQLEPNTFVKLTDPWQEGHSIIYKDPEWSGSYDIVDILKVGKDKVLVSGWASILYIYDKDQLIPIEPAEFNVGDEVQVPHIGSYTNGVIKEIDEAYQRAKVEIEFASEKQDIYVPLCDITTGLEID